MGKRKNILPNFSFLIRNAVQNYLQRIAKLINIPSGIKFAVIFSFPGPICHSQNLHIILVNRLGIRYLYATNINKHK